MTTSHAWDGDAGGYRRLLRRTLVALAATAALVLVSYLFVDRPVAAFVHNRELSHVSILKWLTYVPPAFQWWTPVILTALAVRRAAGPFRHWQRALLSACVGAVLADQFRETLGYAAGRTWPETWTDNNLSYIRDGAFGFHPFHGGAGYGSFPSGHAARTAAVAAAVCVAYPRWRWLAALAFAAEALALVGMNYHFVSDVVAGGFVGSSVGTTVAYAVGVRPPTGFVRT